MPASVQNAGTSVQLPKGPLTAQQTAALMAKLVKSDRKNARAVRAAKAFYYREVAPPAKRKRKVR